MGLLADVFSYGDGLKRKMRGLLEDPVGTVDLGARRFNEDQGGLLNLFANAYPMAGDKTVLNTPEQRKQMQAEAAEKALEVYGGLLGATVWHGSPHKFDKFDSSKIGTGEGAQAYGHGLYLAESPAVAGQYKKWLANYDVPPSAELGVSDAARDTLLGALKVGDGNKAAQSMRNWAQKAGTKQRRYEFQKLADMLDGGVNFGGGSLYKVDLPDNAIAKMLDWDKPLSQQPEVMKVLRESTEFGPNSPNWAGAPKGQWESNIGARTGSDFYIRNKWSDNSKAASDALRAQGIPGIRYLDGGSRGAGGGTSNYVMFPGNEGLLKILERNGSPIP